MVTATINPEHQPNMASLSASLYIDLTATYEGETFAESKMVTLYSDSTEADFLALVEQMKQDFAAGLPEMYERRVKAQVAWQIASDVYAKYQGAEL